MKFLHFSVQKVTKDYLMKVCPRCNEHKDEALFKLHPLTTRPEFCIPCRGKAARRAQNKKARARDAAENNERHQKLIKAKSAKRTAERAAERLRLATTPRTCPRCEESKFEKDFKVIATTSNPEVCIKCRKRIVNHKFKRIDGKTYDPTKGLPRPQRRPAFADRAKIRQVYAHARQLRAQGFECHVDHIVPLRGGIASGLHTHENLRIVGAAHNIAKGNKVRGNEYNISAWRPQE